MVKYLKIGGRNQIQNSNKGSFVRNVQKLFNSFPVTLDSNHIYASQVTPSGQDDRTLRTLKRHCIQNQCNKHLENTYYLPGTVLGTGHRHELNMAPVLKGLTACGETDPTTADSQKSLPLRQDGLLQDNF